MVDDCWLWAKATRKGYGRIRNAENHKMEQAHRLVYEALVRPIPAGLTLDHLCKVRECINPAHLEPVTNEENIRRARQTHCQNGHDLAIYASKDRHCRACKVVYDKQRRSNKLILQGV